MAADAPLPMTREQVIDRYFLEHRAKLIDLAAFLDRVERAPGSAGPEDYRLSAIRGCIALLIDGDGNRARRVLDHLSDPSEDPIPAAHTKGAAGAYPEPRTPGPGPR